MIDPSAATLEQFLRELDPDRFYVDPDVARDALRRRSMFNVIDMNTAWKVDRIVRWVARIAMRRTTRSDVALHVFSSELRIEVQPAPKNVQP